MKRKESLEKRKKKLDKMMAAGANAVSRAKKAWAEEASKEEMDRKTEEYGAWLADDNEADPVQTLRLLIIKLRRLGARLSKNNLTMSSQKNSRQITAVVKQIEHALAGQYPPPPPPSVFPSGDEIDDKDKAYLSVILPDSDSDFDDVLDLLSFRIQRVAALYSDEEERGKLLAAAAHLFKRVFADNYERAYLRNVEAKWGELKHDESEPDELGCITCEHDLRKGDRR